MFKKRKLINNRVVRKLQFSQAESSPGLITKPGLDSVNFRLKNAKCVAFCKTCKLARRLVDNQPGRANKSNHVKRFLSTSG
jgi:hypothetical protein